MIPRTRPELPFTVIIEPPSGPELRRWVCNPGLWFVALMFGEPGRGVRLQAAHSARPE